MRRMDGTDGTSGIGERYRDGDTEERIRVLDRATGAERGTIEIAPAP